MLTALVTLAGGSAEPTAPLDSEPAQAVMPILNQMAKQYQTAIIVVTHDEKIIPTFKRLYNIRDGGPTRKPAQGASLNSLFRGFAATLASQAITPATSAVARRCRQHRP